MIIKKILNNNVVVINDEKGIEKIIMGCGLAFQKKVGDLIDESKVDKIFALSNPETNYRFQELLIDIPIEYIDLSEEIIVYAKTHLGKKLDDTLYISLVDHIHAAVTRFLEGIVIKNPLLWDIKRFYSEEYRIGLKALDMIEEKFNVRLSNDEVGFIALHLANAEMEGTMQDVYEVTKVMQEVSNIVKYTFNVNFNEDSVYYYRFITHLRFFAQRLLSKKTYEDEKDDDLLKIIKGKYKNSYECVNKISDFILKEYQYSLSNEEKLYLTIHIERVIYKESK